MFYYAILALLLSMSVQAKPKRTALLEKPFYEIQKTTDGFNNQITLLESGIGSFKQRLDLIRKAQKNIEVEYFIYATDRSAKLFTLELIKAAERGVKVRILVDASIAVLALDKYFVKEMEAKGLEVKHYNTASIFRISSIQFRSHRKLLAVDDQYAITGGRNMEDDYYDISTSYNFIDRDILIEGPIVKTMRESFDKFFEHKISKKVKRPKKPRPTRIKEVERDGKMVTVMVPNKKALKKYYHRTQQAKNFVTEFQEDIKLREQMEAVGDQASIDLKSHSCPETTYASDMPGGNFFRRLKENYSDNYRGVRKALYDHMKWVNHEVLISSPYVLNNRHSRRMMNHFLNRDVKLKIYTNSLASTDAVYVAALLYDKVFNWIDQGIEVYVHPGNYVEEFPAISDEVKQARWGTHSKSMVFKSLIDNESVQEIMVGTYNIDNRSNYYNNEMAIFCKGNNELAQELSSNIESRMSAGYRINADRTATDKDGNTVSIFGVDESNLRKMKWLRIPAKIFKFLL